jgi:hypothetical protein
MVLGVFAVLALVVCMAGGVVVWRKTQDPEVKKALSAAGKGLSLITRASTAPGTKELRALGCTQAFVFGRAEMGAVLSEVFDAGKGFDDDYESVVACQANASLAPSCDVLAAAYVKAALPTERFRVSATVGGAESCSGTYEPSGQRLEAPAP